MPRTPSRRILKSSRKPIHPLVAQEFYIYEAVRKKPARVFYRESEQRAKAEREVITGGHAAFRFHDVVFFCVIATANGVLGNLAYDALKRSVAAIRKPKLEIGGITFSSVVKRSTYNRERRKKHPKTKGLATSVKIQARLEEEYERIVSVKWE